MTTRASGPSWTMSTKFPTAPSSGGEERDAPRHLDRRAGDVARLLAAEERDRVRDVRRLAEALEHGPALEALVHRVARSRAAPGLGQDDSRHHSVGHDPVPAAFQDSGPGQPEHPGLDGRVAGLAESAQG